MTNLSPSGDLVLVAVDQATIYSVPVAIAIIGGADPDNPLSWGPHIIHPQDFRARFTPAERVAILNASSTDLDVKDNYDFLHMASHVDLTHTDTIGGVDLLIYKGLIESTRKPAILAY